MGKYISRAAMILYINILIGLTHGLHQLEVINFVPDSYYFIIPVSFLLTFAIWNALLVFDKKEWEKTSVMFAVRTEKQCV